jgi:hypothetical protein
MVVVTASLPSETAELYPEQPSGKKNVESNRIESNRIFARDFARMQVVQCGNQKAHAEVLRQMRRAVRAIATRVNFQQCRCAD